MELLKITDIKKVSVIGAGLMGTQIAEVLSRFGKYNVYLTDVSDELVKKGLATIEQRLDKFLVSKGKMTPEEKKEVTSRINGVADITRAVSDADFVIEAVIENLSIKKAVFRSLDEKSPPHAILASNTSWLSITEMASATRRPDKVVGIHFFNPVALMKLVEVVRGANTSTSTIEVTCALARVLEKEPVVCSDASFGFLANRAYIAMQAETVQMVWEKIASPEDIDKALKLGYNLPVGPLELGDMIGSWGIRAASEEDRMKELGSGKGCLHPLLKLMVRAGYTGGSGKKGIYDFWKEVMMKQ